MQPTVRAFNALPRPETTPTELDNHWYFAIRHVPLQPPGDLVHIVHPRSRFLHCEGSAQILSLPTPAAQADVVVPLLLEAFVNGISSNPDGTRRQEAPAFAPWTWATKDRDLARAIETKLENIGVKKALCVVQAGTKEEEDISNESWSHFYAQLTKQLARAPTTGGTSSAAPTDRHGTPACDVCRKASSSLSEPLKRCAGCSDALYCSRECQKSDWKAHKKVCSKSKSPEANAGGTGAPKLDAYQYYNRAAHKVPEAQRLANSVNLTLPTGDNDREGIMKPIRRLVITGKDTTENLALLLGPDWKKTEATTYEEARLHVLLRPPPGSPSMVMFSPFDDGSPWSPRPPGTAENAKIQKVRDLQAKIVERVGPRKEPSSQDMQAILSSLGPNWTDMLPTYQLACNTLDQGVRGL